MISGAHVVLYSSDAEADRVFLRDVLGFSHVDAGGGWLIFRLPPAEVAVHPAEAGGRHELYLTTRDVAVARSALTAQGVTCNEPVNEGWGVLMRVALPSGAEIGLYEPRHAMPE